MAANTGNDIFYNGRLITAPLFTKVHHTACKWTVKYNLTGLFSLLCEMMFDSMPDNEISEMADRVIANYKPSADPIYDIVRGIASMVENAVREGVPLTTIASMGMVMPKHSYTHIEQYGDDVVAVPVNCVNCGLSYQRVMHRIGLSESISHKIEGMYMIIKSHA